MIITYYIVHIWQCNLQIRLCRFVDWSWNKLFTLDSVYYKTVYLHIRLWRCIDYSGATLFTYISVYTYQTMTMYWLFWSYTVYIYQCIYISDCDNVLIDLELHCSHISVYIHIRLCGCVSDLELHCSHISVYIHIWLCGYVDWSGATLYKRAEIPFCNDVSLFANSPLGQKLWIFLSPRHYRQWLVSRDWLPRIG